MGRAPISKWSSAVTKSAWRERTLPGAAPSSVATYGISTNRWAVFVGAHPRRTHAAPFRFVLPIVVIFSTGYLADNSTEISFVPDQLYSHSKVPS